MKLVYPPRDAWGCYAALRRIEAKISTIADLEQAIWHVECGIEMAAIAHEFEGKPDLNIKRFRMVLLALRKTLAIAQAKPQQTQQTVRAIQRRRSDDHLVADQKAIREQLAQQSQSMAEMLRFIELIDRRVAKLAIGTPDQGDADLKTTFILDEAQSTAQRIRARQSIHRRSPPRPSAQGFGSQFKL